MSLLLPESSAGGAAVVRRGAARWVVAGGAGTLLVTTGAAVVRRGSGDGETEEVGEALGLGESVGVALGVVGVAVGPGVAVVADGEGSAVGDCEERATATLEAPLFFSGLGLAALTTRRTNQKEPTTVRAHLPLVDIALFHTAHTPNGGKRSNPTAITAGCAYQRLRGPAGTGAWNGGWPHCAYDMSVLSRLDATRRRWKRPSRLRV